MGSDLIAIENEKKSNKNLLIATFILLAVLIACMIYFSGDYYTEEEIFWGRVLVIVTIVTTVIATTLNFVLPEKYLFIKKYFLAVALLILNGTFASQYVQVLMGFPPIALGLFSRYYNKKFMYQMSAVTFFLAVLYGVVGAYTGLIVDLNIVEIAPGTTITMPEYSAWLVDAIGDDIIDGAERVRQFAVNLLPPMVVEGVAVTVIFSKICQSGTDLIGKRTEEAKRAAIVDRDLSTAMNIQTSFLSTAFEPFETQNDIEVFASMKAARQVGGDFYDFCNIDDNRVFFVMGDVSGKGIPAALFMVKSQACLHELAYKGLNPAEILTQANNILIEHNSEGFYVTLWIGILDKTTGELEYANAGHVPPYICRRSGEYEELSCEINFVCGMMPDMEYVLERTELHSGDRLYTCTDGVTDCSNTAKEFYGAERLHTLLNELKDASCKETVDTIDEALVSFQGEADQFDDITMMMIRRK